MSKWILLAALVVTAYILWPKSKVSLENSLRPVSKISHLDKTQSGDRPQKIRAKTTVIPQLASEVEPEAESTNFTQHSSQENSRLRSYTVDGDGLAVFDGDIVLGRLREGSPQMGKAELPQMNLWPTREIPIFIQPSVRDPERVHEALSLFNSTVIKFVPYTDQEDVLVFEDGTGVCKSYVGKIGGKQPVWIPQDCRPTEIAHEIMHALGFIHEQNRVDRDNFVQVQFDNIEKSAAGNFEKLPQDFMEISGGSSFAFRSVMIYPPSMFSRNGDATMLSKVPGETIEPGRQLSNEDILRINSIYGRR